MTAKEARDKLNEKLSKIDIQKEVDAAIEEAIAKECNHVTILSTIHKSDKNKARIEAYLTKNGFTNILIINRLERDFVYEGSSDIFFTISFDF